MLQTKKRKERRSKDHRECNGGFFSGQGVSTNTPAFIDSKIQLPEESMKDFLDYFGARKYEMNKGYYHKWSLTICDGCFDTLKSSKMRS